MADIKSALELALEKAEQYGRASKEEMELAQYQEQGRRLAVQFLKGEGDLEADLKSCRPRPSPPPAWPLKRSSCATSACPGKMPRTPARTGPWKDCSWRPTTARPWRSSRRNWSRSCNNFSTSAANALQQLKARFAAGVGQMQQAMEAKYRQPMNMDVERLPQFQEEWLRFKGQLQQQFEPVMANLKERMRLA